LFLIYFAFERSKKARNLEDPAKESPKEILKRRYAKGEIIKEEFERLKKEIET
jgi:putative membrane protein